MVWHMAVWPVWLVWAVPKCADSGFHAASMWSVSNKDALNALLFGLSNTPKLQWRVPRHATGEPWLQDQNDAKVWQSFPHLAPILNVRLRTNPFAAALDERFSRWWRRGNTKIVVYTCLYRHKIKYCENISWYVHLGVLTKKIYMLQKYTYVDVYNIIYHMTCSSCH